MAALKNMLISSVFPRERRQATATSTSTNTNTNTNTSTTAVGRGGEGTTWDPDICWRAAAVGVVGTAALCFAVLWYMGRGGVGDEGESRGSREEEEQQQQRKLRARVEAERVDQYGQEAEYPPSSMLAKCAREDYKERKNDIKHMQQLLDHILPGKGSMGIARRAKLRKIEQLLGRIEDANDRLAQEIAASANAIANRGDGGDSEGNN